MQSKKKLKGKPYPDQIDYVIKRLKFDKSRAYYIGDMYVDYKASKNSKINFIFANYGYGREFKSYDKRIRKFEEIFNFLV